MKDPTVLKESEYKDNIIKYAIGSRLIVFFLQLLSNILIPDHNANVFLYPKENVTATNLDNTVLMMFEGFTKWDAQYFIHIALYGYTYENSIAFFPLYPFLIRYLSWILGYFLSVLNIQSVVLLVSFIFNLYLFQKTALILFELSCLFQSLQFAYVVSILFCFNPASIFFSSIYSECLFCFLTFQSMLQGINFSVEWLESASKYLSLRSCWSCIIYIALSTITRSNGNLNIVFFVYIYLRVLVDKFYLKCYKFSEIFLSIVILLFYILLMFLPFVLLQIYDYQIFCSHFQPSLPEFLINFGETHQLVIRGSFLENNQSWCYKTIPFAYSYVQDHYWNVGFLKYYEVKQIPNFCLALPVIYISFKNVMKYLANNRDMLIHFGVLRKAFVSYNIVNSKQIKNYNRTKLFFFDMEFVFVTHVLFLTLFCLLCIHVQVTTRMIFSSTPIIYWFCCYSLYSNNGKEKLFIKCYFVLYFIVGIFMFCNFLPWT